MRGATGISTSSPIRRRQATLATTELHPDVGPINHHPPYRNSFLVEMTVQTRPSQVTQERPRVVRVRFKSPLEEPQPPVILPMWKHPFKNRREMCVQTQPSHTTRLRPKQGRHPPPPPPRPPPPPPRPARKRGRDRYGRYTPPPPMWGWKPPPNPSKLGQPAGLLSIPESPPRLPAIPRIPSLDGSAPRTSEGTHVEHVESVQHSEGAARKPGIQGTIPGIAHLARKYLGTNYQFDGAQDDPFHDQISINPASDLPSHSGHSSNQNASAGAHIQGSAPNEQLSQHSSRPGSNQNAPQEGSNQGASQGAPQAPQSQGGHSTPAVSVQEAVSHASNPEHNDDNNHRPRRSRRASTESYRRSRVLKYIKQTYRVRPNKPNVPKTSRGPPRVVVLELDDRGEANRGFARFRGRADMNHVRELLGKLTEFGALKSFRILKLPYSYCLTFEYENKINLYMAMSANPFMLDGNTLQAEVGMKCMEGRRKGFGIRYKWKPAPLFHPDQDFEEGSEMGVSGSRYLVFLRSYLQDALATVARPDPIIIPDPRRVRRAQNDGTPGSNDTLLGSPRDDSQAQHSGSSADTVRERQKGSKSVFGRMRKAWKALKDDFHDAVTGGFTAPVDPRLPLWAQHR